MLGLKLFLIVPYVYYRFLCVLVVSVVFHVWIGNFLLALLGGHPGQPCDLSGRPQPRPEEATDRSGQAPKSNKTMTTTFTLEMLYSRVSLCT